MTEQLDGLSMDLEGANKEKLQSVFQSVSPRAD